MSLSLWVCDSDLDFDDDRDIEDLVRCLLFSYSHCCTLLFFTLCVCESVGVKAGVSFYGNY